MASSHQNLSSILNPWAFSSSTTHQDSWISDVFSRETQSLTQAIHRSFLDSDSDALSSFLDLISPESTPTPTSISGGGGFGSEPETAAPKRQRTSIPATGGKVSKRKSRASKRNHTTFITADPANFRQMVQQVTGVRFGNSQVQIPPVLKPEPHRPGGRFAVCGGGAAAGLPTLDTSAFLLNHHQQQSSGSGSEITGPTPLSYGPGFGLQNNGPIGSDFDTFSSFPTLESWKAVM